MNNLDNINIKSNQDIIESHNSLNYCMNLHSSFLNDGISYRLNKKRFENLLQKTWHGKEPIFSACKTVYNEKDYLEVVLKTSLRPILLTKKTYSKILQLGDIINSAIKASEKLIEEKKDLLPNYFKSERSEAKGIGLNNPECLSPLTRIDFFLLENEGEFTPKVFDINLLPGMTFISNAIYKSFNKTSKGIETAKYFLGITDFAGDQVIKHMKSMFFNWLIRNNYKNDFLNVAIVIRESHGLHSDMVLLENIFKSENINAKVVYPVEILNVSSNTILTTKGEFNAVFRMVRPVTKHIENFDIYEKENKIIDCIFENYCKKKLFVYPGFHIYLENHVWSWVWRNPKFTKFYECQMGSNAYSILQNLLPKTALITNKNSLLWDNNIESNLDESKLNKIVIKRGDSTGSKYVQVLAKPSKSQRVNELQYIFNDIDFGLIAQELIPCSKEILPVLDNDGHLKLKKGNVQFLGYFNEGKCIGCIALFSTTSKKIHGGSDSYLVPIKIL